MKKYRCKQNEYIYIYMSLYLEAPRTGRSCICMDLVSSQCDIKPIKHGGIASYFWGSLS